MTSTLIDTNVLLDIVEKRENWLAWSEASVRRLLKEGPIVINPVIYAEASVPYIDEAEFAAIVDTVWLRREDLPWNAAFRAGKAFLQYRKKGGEKGRNLPDFFIGAHAAVKRYRLLTRDALRFRTYFPEIDIVAPDTHP